VITAVTGTNTGVSGVGVPLNFLTLAASWHTAAPTKWGRHGRIYPPLTLTQASTGSSRITAATATGVVNWAKLLLTAIAKPPNTGANFNAVRPVVASNHAGEIFEINEVRCGDVVDVQRRRKSALMENYTKSPWS
jgi:hypothetical protein